MYIEKIKVVAIFVLLNLIPSFLMWGLSQKMFNNFNYIGFVGILISTIWYYYSTIFSIKARNVELKKADTYTSYLGTLSILVMVFYILDMDIGAIITNITKGVALGNPGLLTAAFFCILYHFLDSSLNNIINNIVNENSNNDSKNLKAEIKKHIAVISSLELQVAQHVETIEHLQDQVSNT